MTDETGVADVVSQEPASQDAAAEEVPQESVAEEPAQQEPAQAEETDEPAAEAGAGQEERSESRKERLVKQLEEEGDLAADYLEELLDIADLDGDIDIDVDGDRASVEIRNADRLERLNGRSGELLDALQELTRLAVQTSTGTRSRLMLDIGGYRRDQRDELTARAEEAIAEVKESGEPVSLESMNPFERKVVHDAVRAAGLHSDSEGEGASRHVVVHPAAE